MSEHNTTDCGFHKKFLIIQTCLALAHWPSCPGGNGLSGWEKIINPLWIDQTLVRSLRVHQRRTGEGAGHTDVQNWYASFLQNAVLPHVHGWSAIVAYGETLVGLGLILGLFTGLAAFSGSFMNWNFLMAGTVSVNPILMILSIWIILARRVAGRIGLDRLLHSRFRKF